MTVFQGILAILLILGVVYFIYTKEVKLIFSTLSIVIIGYLIEVVIDGETLPAKAWVILIAILLLFIAAFIFLHRKETKERNATGKKKRKRGRG